MKKFYVLIFCAFISLECFSQNVVINKVLNSGVAAGTGDAVELIVVGAHPLATVDLRGMMIKNYTANGATDAGGCYTFTTNALWSNVKSGTIIVLRRNTASTDVSITAGTDFNLDINLDDATYFTAGTNAMNIISADMVLIKAAGSTAAGETGAIHALSFGNTNPTTPFTNVTSPKLRTVTSMGTAGSFAYVANFNGFLSDFNSATPPAGLNVATPTNADVISGGISLGTPTVLASGNSRNSRFVNILRPSVVIESVYNSGLTNGIGDVIKLKVLSASNLDMRGMFIKDFKTNGTASNIYYKFSDAVGSIFASVPSGTVITLTRAASGTSADVNSADLTLDLLLINTVNASSTEINSTNTDATNFFDVDENDMVVLQPSADNNLNLNAEAIVVHAMAYGSVFSTAASKYELIGFGPKVGIATAVPADAKIEVQNTSSPINYYNSNLSVAFNVLPVELISFTAKKQLNSVILKWNSLSESNNARYDIYRADNGVDFIKLASVNGAGTSLKELNYSYNDNNPLAGDNYYKLVQVDFDGKEKVLKIIVLNNSLESLNAYINNNILIINAFSAKQQTANISLYNTNGQVLYKESLNLQKGSNALSLEIKNDASFYILKVQLDNDILVRKVANITF